ncbi:MAG: hypothetical protein RLZZ93_196, partial [Actinomycetota bacterium]
GDTPRLMLRTESPATSQRKFAATPDMNVE